MSRQEIALHLLVSLTHDFYCLTHNSVCQQLISSVEQSDSNLFSLPIKFNGRTANNQDQKPEVGKLLRMFVQRYFDKKSEELKAEDVQNFIAKKIEENVNLDYKGILVLNDIEKIAKHVCAFANTEGGLLVLGVSEERKLVGKRIERIYPRVVEWADHSYSKERLESAVRNTTDPPVPLKIVPIRKSKDDPKAIFLLEIPRSNELHMHKKTHHFYKRLNFESPPMEREEIINFIRLRLSYEKCAWFRFHVNEALLEFMDGVLVRLNPIYAEKSDRDRGKVPREFESFVGLPHRELIDVVRKITIRDLRRFDGEVPYLIADLDKANTYSHEDITPEERVLFDDLRELASNLPWDWHESLIEDVKDCEIHSDWLSLSISEFARATKYELEFLDQVSNYLRFLVSFSKDILKLKLMLDGIQEKYGKFESCEVVQSQYGWLKS